MKRAKMGKGFRARIRDPSSMSGAALLATHHVGVGANMAVRRSVLRQIGGFDTALDVGTPSHGGGDLDMFRRIMLTGAAARYEPSAMLWHFHRPTRTALWHQMVDNGRAFGTYLLKCFGDGRASRSAVARYAASWICWLIVRIPRRFLKRERMPISLIGAELWGALHAPDAYLRTYARDRKLRHAMSAATP